MSTAKVSSIEAVREFRAALIQFAEEAASALQMMTAQIQRAQDWVEHERPGYWQQQIKLAFDEISETRTRLNACLMRTVANHKPSCIEEKQAHRAAKQRLEYCQQMVPQVKQWAVKFTHESDEYRGRMGTLTRAVEVDLPRMIGLIDRTATALEKYAEMTAEPVDSARESASKTSADETSTEESA